MPVAPPPKPAAATARASGVLCRHCHQALGALAVARGLLHCEAAACRARENQLALDQRWSQLAVQALAAAAAQQADADEEEDAAAHASAAPQVVLWLEHGGRSLVPVNDHDRAFLAARWLQAWQDDKSLNFGGLDSAVDLPASAAALCGHCAGRCCAYGSGQAAFVDAATLRRWLAAHPGATVEDAIADYLAHLPLQHVEGQCCFQDTTGCALPRENRADVCNQYRCDALTEMGRVAAADGRAAAVVLTRNGWRLQRAAVFSQGVATELPGLADIDFDIDIDINSPA